MEQVDVKNEMGRRARWVGVERGEPSGVESKGEHEAGAPEPRCDGRTERKRDGEEGERQRRRGEGEGVWERGHCKGARYASNRPVASTKSRTAVRALTFPTVFRSVRGPSTAVRRAWRAAVKRRQVNR